MLSGYKTYITAAVAVITAVASYIAGEATLPATAQLVFTALLAAFVRDGIATKFGQTSYHYVVEKA